MLNSDRQLKAQSLLKRHDALRLTGHARHRAAQRGISPEHLAFVLDHADREFAVGNGVVRCFISASTCDQLRSQGMPDDVLDAAAKTQVLLTCDERVVTVYKTTARRPLRTRRHGMRSNLRNRHPWRELVSDASVDQPEWI